MTYSLDAATRTALRAELLTAARQAARRRFCSAKCLDNSPFDPPRHAGELDGCRNDGSGCLCECHDGGGS